MALFNYATKEITLKIVYYGPGLSGKTTNLQYLHSVLNPDTKGKLLSLSTESDRTLFFDFLPIELGKIRDFSIRFQLYTVPGQVRYNATRKVVLKGADAIVFVADSQSAMREQNMESFANMRENLFANNINPDEIPVILQYNKRDLNNVLSVEELNADLNPYSYSVTEATAVNGAGVEETFKLVTKLLLKFIAKKHKIEIQPVSTDEAPQPTATAAEVRPPAPVVEPPAEAVTIPEAIPFDTEELAEEVVSPAYSGELELTPEYELESESVHPAYAEAISDELTKLPEAAALPPSPGAPAAPSVPDKSYDELAIKIDMIWQNMREFSVRVDRLSEEVSAVRETSAELLKATGRLLEEKKPARDRELPEIRQGQAELTAIIKDVAATLEQLKEKKAWFKF